MQVFKFILLFLVFGGASYIGVLMSKRYSNRTEELKQIKTALSMLETKIKFTYEPLPEIFEQISKTMTENVGKIFDIANTRLKNSTVKDAWKEAVDKVSLNINTEDKAILKELGNLLRTNRCRRTS